MRMLKVLLVDDQPREIEGMRRLIDWNALGLTIVGAALTGREGLAMAAKLAPDIVVTDVIMPDMDGLAMLEALKQERPSTRVICISCFDDFKFVSFAINMGACGYVLKPILARELESVLQRALGEERAHREREALVTRFAGLQAMPELTAGMAAWRLLARGLTQEQRSAVLRLTGWPDAFAVAVLAFADARPVASLLPGAVLLPANPREQLALFPLHGRQAYDKEAAALKRALLELGGETGVPARAGLSLPVPAERLPEALAQAREAADRAFSAAGLVVYEPREDAEAFSPAAAQGELSELWQRMDTTQLEEFLARVLPPLGRNALLARASALLAFACAAPGAFVSFEEASSRIGECVEREQLIATLLEIIDGAATRSEKGGTEVTAKIKQYVREHLSEPMRTKDMFQAIYMSAGHAGVLFKGETGLTIHQYVMKERMAAAAELLLAHPEKRVYEIALQVGFPDAAYFINVFRRAYRCTPAQYRSAEGRP